MPLTNKQKQEALRKRRAILKQRRWEIYVTDEERPKIKKFIKEMRNGKRNGCDKADTRIPRSS